MITQDMCQRAASCIGMISPASESDWAVVHELVYSVYRDVSTLHGSSPIAWEITPVMQYQFELSAEQLQSSVCAEFITELYTTYFYFDGLTPYVESKDDAFAWKIVLHALRVVILFFEHQFFLENPKGYENFKKYMHI